MNGNRLYLWSDSIWIKQEEFQWNTLLGLFLRGDMMIPAWSAVDWVIKVSILESRM